MVDCKSFSSGAAALALAGAVSMVTAAGPAAAAEDDMVKCYGISQAGENDCETAMGLRLLAGDAAHSCAGLATVDYAGYEWRAVPARECEQLSGSTEPFEGVNPVYS